jgi:hypothetical protein
VGAFEVPIGEVAPREDGGGSERIGGVCVTDAAGDGVAPGVVTVGVFDGTDVIGLNAAAG